MYSSHRPSSHAQAVAVSQSSYSSYAGGICLDHKTFAYQPNPRAASLTPRERSALFETTFAQNPNGLNSEAEYRRLATNLNITVQGVKGRFRNAQKRLKQQRQQVGFEGLCIAARQALAEMGS